MGQSPTILLEDLSNKDMDLKESCNKIVYPGHRHYFIVECVMAVRWALPVAFDTAAVSSAEFCPMVETFSTKGPH